ncbi:hypothetical protein ACEWY4_025175 [Coilia grayii]|uniref:C-type lectin domain-containing protein n=1 Tax=Coilia grayii TaxID=363190 RepID=A0ABD1IZV1_9TELE
MFACFHSFCSAVSLQYFFVNEATTWTAAQTYCRTHYTDLATLYNTDDVNALTQLGGQTGSAWIGLYDDSQNSWRWSITDSSFYGPGETEFRNWYAPTSEPNNAGGNELCGEIYPNGFWNDISCTAGRQFVCYGANDTYVLIQQTKSWNDAQAHCRSNYIDLASIRNATENEKVRAAAQGATAYMGLYRTRTWSDGSDSSFRNWKSGQPDSKDQCTAVSFTDSGQWTDENCSNTYPFFCYRAATALSTLRVVVDSATELTEAEIEETIIKPLREELLRNGLPNSTTLRLRRVHRANP